MDNKPKMIPDFDSEKERMLSAQALTVDKPKSKLFIIGLSGRMQSGKTTVANYLNGNLPNSVISGFFQHAKEAFVDVFGLDMKPSDLNNQNTKNSVHSCGKTYRQMLQEFGRKMRDIDQDIWVGKWKQCLPENGFDFLIVPDVRFEDEVDAIKDLGGVVIRLTRNPVKSGHETETGLDGYEFFDLTVDNANMSEMMTNNLIFEWIQERRY